MNFLHMFRRSIFFKNIWWQKQFFLFSLIFVDLSNINFLKPVFSSQRNFFVPASSAFLKRAKILWFSRNYNNLMTLLSFDLIVFAWIWDSCSSPSLSLFSINFLFWRMKRHDFTISWSFKAFENRHIFLSKECQTSLISSMYCITDFSFLFWNFCMYWT